MGIKESTHWYGTEGQPCYTILGKNGKIRNTTLRDARQLQLVPSVTTILSLTAKDGLINWKINQALLSALTLPRLEDESLDDFMVRAKRDSMEQARQAADRGTEIHAEIERGFQEGCLSPAYESVREAISEFIELKRPIAEASFTHKAGFGGKVDLFDMAANAVIDFKTKDNLADSDASKLVYDDHGMQLSAYALGLEIENPIRISVFIDRQDPTLVKAYLWDIESHSRHSDMFLTLLKYWQLSKQYTPKLNQNALYQ